MIKNYIKVAIRNLLRYKGYSLINIVGLAIGMAGVLLIFLYVFDELSYDRFHKNARQIYRVGQFGNIGDMEFKGTTTPAPLAGALMEDFDEVLYATRILEGINTVMWYKDKSFFETSYLYVDTNFFLVFSFPLIKGDPATVLKKPNSLVIGESTATKYFGDKDPVGKTLHESDGTDYVITGVMKDVPHNSHFHFDFVASISTYKWTSNNNWLNDTYYTYFVLQKGFPYKKFAAKLPLLTTKYVNPQLKSQLGVEVKDWDNSDNNFEYYLEPLTRIYLGSDASPQIEPVSDIKTIYLFSIITIFILILAILNFSSLITAKSATRAREMSMRKVLGSRRRQLIIQLLTESVVVSFLAFILALVLVELFLPTYNNIVSKSLSVKYFKEWFVIPILVLTTIFIGIVSGAYSSLSISSYKTLSVLRGNLILGMKRLWFRSGLVVFQFFIAVVIIIGTIVVYSQLSFISNKKVGFNKENLLIIDRAYGIEDNAKEAFKHDLLKNPDIQHLSMTTTIPGMEGWMGLIMRREDSPPEDMIHFRQLAGDINMFKTYQFEMADGVFFTKDHCCGKNFIVINESAARAVGYDNPVGKKLIVPGESYGKVWSYEIIGVVKDFHFNNMKEKIENLVIYTPRKYFARYVTLRINDENTKETIRFVEKTWKNYAINQPFNYFFLDDKFDDLHQPERRTAKVFTIFSILALFIAGLGLLGLSSFTAEQKTREIGIRKAMGSSVIEISTLFMKEFAKWVIIANLLAWPVAYFLMQGWLNNFVYRLSFPWWTFIVASIASLIIALLSVSYQTALAALKNPSDSIRYE